MHVGKKLNYHLNDFNQLLLGAFAVVIETQKLEVCIHKDNCMVEKRSEIQFTNMSDDTANTDFHHELWDPTENTQQPSMQKFQL